MGLFIRQNDNRSQLQERIAAELREKARLQASSTEPIDQSKRSNYIKDTDATSAHVWVWFAVAALLILALVVFVITR